MGLCRVQRVRKTLDQFVDSPRQHMLAADLGGVWGAIAIGADSEIDRCWVIPVGGDTAMPPNDSVPNDPGHYGVPPNDAVLVSVERPWIGEIAGPFNLVLPYGMQVTHSGSPDNPERWIPLRSTSGSTELEVWQPHTRTPRLTLEFYSFFPGWMPTKRGPIEYAFRHVSFGTSGLSAHELLIPGFGRRQMSIGIRMAGTISAGDVVTTLVGRNAAGAHDIASRVEVAETLLSRTDSANWEAVYLFDGEFDHYELDIAEGNAITGSVTINGVVKLWD